MGKQFDELSKALAGGVSRRTALRRFIAGLAGAVLVSIFHGRASAAVPGDIRRRCAQACQQLFPDRGRDYGECVSSCERCLTAANKDPHFNGSFNSCLPLINSKL
jgi:hypothetical protein